MNYPVNRTDFKLTKGVTTEVMFFIKDVDRKPVTISQMSNTGVTALRVVITDENTGDLLLGTQTPFDPNAVVDAKSILVPAPGITPDKGVWMLKLDKLDIVDWPLGMLRYSIIMDRTDDQVMLYSDRGYGPYSQLQVLNGPFPAPREAETILPGDMVFLGPSRYSGAYRGAANVGNISGQHSIVAKLTGFKGSITLQGSLENSPSQNDADWFYANVTNSMSGTITNGTVTFNSPTDGPVYIAAIGNYMWMRFIVHEAMDAAGTFNSIDYRAD